jgi:hypothetical protein
MPFGWKSSRPLLMPDRISPTQTCAAFPHMTLHSSDGQQPYFSYAGMALLVSYSLTRRLVLSSGSTARRPEPQTCAPASSEMKMAAAAAKPVKSRMYCTPAVAATAALAATALMSGAHCERNDKCKSITEPAGARM